MRLAASRYSTPSVCIASISAAPKPSDWRLRALCCPRNGAGLRGAGVAIGEAERQVRQAQRAEARMILLDDHAPRVGLRIGDHLVDALHLAQGTSAASSSRQHRRARAAPATQGLHVLPECCQPVRVAVGLAVWKRGSAPKPARAADAAHGQQALPALVHLRGDDQVAIRGAEHAVERRLSAWSLPGLLGQRRLAACRLDRVVVHGDHAVVEGQVDVLPLAAASPARTARR